MVTRANVRPITPAEAQQVSQDQYEQIIESLLVFVNEGLRGHTLSQIKHAKIAPSTEAFPLYGYWLQYHEIIAKMYQEVGWEVTIPPEDKSWDGKKLVYLEFAL